ncbi:glycerol-3-phosphate 1-O-acyltransferase PlsY [Gluconacetobacter diazotrophicus]|uniref:glycerol-3-phosphate 1-O-acyltransferase PlsY n=1 Tax=Gluconacetobacter diazotrophicus TaxID=33996 RepID=UPI001199A2AD|nr:glycerol-3-phosphate 1-O-acyltransferase PlsY [Gluconacetobacter diazotrophicus]TWB02471.1 glycerol-3-phosphate acyltransferase PlsY [Gluconacetobacter diazotrophicus]
MNGAIPAFALPLLAAIGVLAYCIGSIPFGLLLTQFGGAGDIRTIGSGNIGATNVLRTGRRGLAAATLLLDGAKGVFAVMCGFILSPFHTGPAMAVAALFAVVGHCLPVWLKFRGGKGVATGLGAVLALSPLTGLACCAIWLGVARLTRISSAGALAAFAAMPMMLAALNHTGDGPAIPVGGLLIALLVIARHRGNIRRLVDGTEPRIGRKRP